MSEWRGQETYEAAWRQKNEWRREAQSGEAGPCLHAFDSPYVAGGCKVIRLKCSKCGLPKAEFDFGRSTEKL